MRNLKNFKKSHVESFKLFQFKHYFNISFSQKLSRITNQPQPKSGPII